MRRPGVHRRHGDRGCMAVGRSCATAGPRPKKLEVIRELLPAATRVAVLLNPSSPLSVPFLIQLQPAAKALGFQLDVVGASKDSDLEPAFVKVKDELKADALVMAPDVFYNIRTEQIAKLGARASCLS